MYIIYMILIIINICFLYKKSLFKNKIITDKKNTYIKYNSELESIKIINVISILLNLLYYILLFAEGFYINLVSILNLLLYFFNIASFLILIAKRKYKNVKIKCLNKYVSAYSKTILYNIFSSLIILIRVGEVHNTLVIHFSSIALFLFIVADIILIILLLCKNKSIVSFNVDEKKDYVKEIKYYKKIKIKKFYNYCIWILMYIFLVYCNIPYSYIFYILIMLSMFIYLIKKIKSFNVEKNKLYRNITIVKNKPGIVYAFEFERDLRITKTIAEIFICFCISILSFYILGSMAFVYISIQLYIYIIYNSIINKIRLISSIYSLNETFIDKKVYNIKKEKVNLLIEEINYFYVIKFYKLVYIVDDSLFESNIVLYDPELYINNIDIYLNSNNINDYIIVNSSLYI